MANARNVLAAGCGLASATWALVVPIAAGRVEPGYDARAQFISELGAAGAANAALVSWAGFAPIGLLVLAFLALAYPLLPGGRSKALGVAGLAAVGAAYLASAAFPCDAGCPSAGSTSQSIHNAFGLPEYVGAAIGLVVLAYAFRAAGWSGMALVSVAAAIVVAGALLAMLGELAPRGLVQRVGETAIFGWIAVASVVLLRASEAES